MCYEYISNVLWALFMCQALSKTLYMNYIIDHHNNPMKYEVFLFPFDWEGTEAYRN